MIGIIDIGIGGVFLVRAMQALLPRYDMIYYGCQPSIHPPAPRPSPPKQAAGREQIPAPVKWLISQGARLLVVPFPPHTGMAPHLLAASTGLPVIDGGPHLIAEIMAKTGATRIGMLGLNQTGPETYLAPMIRSRRREAVLLTKPSPLLACLVETGWLRNPETPLIVKKHLHPLRVKQINTLLLAATHFHAFHGMIRSRIGKKTVIVDLVNTMAAAVHAYLKTHPTVDSQLSRNDKVRYVMECVTPENRHAARRLFHQTLSFETIT